MMFFKKKVEISPTGVFAISGKKLIPLNELPKEGSINDIAESLGYPNCHTIHLFNSKEIGSIGFKRYTREPVFVLAKDNAQPLSYSDISKAIKEIDWDFENRQLGFEDSL